MGERVTLYHNAHVLDPASGFNGPGEVLVRGASFVDVGSNIFPDGVPEKITKVDCEACYLVPGLIDMRAYLPGVNARHRETMVSASQAAVAGGITTVVMAANAAPVIDNVALFEAVTRRGKEVGLVTLLAYGAITTGLQGEQLTEMGLLNDAGCVGFMDGFAPAVPANTMLKAMKYTTMFGGLVLQHPQEPSFRSGVINQGSMATRLGLPGIPSIAEVMLIERDLRLVAATNARYHVCHVSTAAAVEAIRGAKKRGLPVTCDTAPPYFTLTEDDVADYNTATKINPPLRSSSDKTAIIAGIADGTIDAIVSDHNPQDEDSKQLPFSQAAFGMIGLETLLPLSLNLVHEHGLPLLTVLHCLTAGPANILRHKAGQIADQYPADLMLFNGKDRWRLDSDQLFSKSQNTPFLGHKLYGKCHKTVRGGQTVFSASKHLAGDHFTRQPF